MRSIEVVAGLYFAKIRHDQSDFADDSSSETAVLRECIRIKHFKIQNLFFLNRFVCFVLRDSKPCHDQFLIVIICSERYVGMLFSPIALFFLLLRIGPCIQLSPSLVDIYGAEPHARRWRPRRRRQCKARSLECRGS